MGQMRHKGLHLNAHCAPEGIASCAVCHVQQQDLVDCNSHGVGNTMTMVQMRHKGPHLFAHDAPRGFASCAG